MEARNGETGAQETDSSRFHFWNRLSTNPANRMAFQRACPPEQRKVGHGIGTVHDLIVRLAEFLLGRLNGSWPLRRPRDGMFADEVTAGRHRGDENTVPAWCE